MAMWRYFDRYYIITVDGSDNTPKIMKNLSEIGIPIKKVTILTCLLYTSPSPRD